MPDFFSGRRSAPLRRASAGSGAPGSAHFFVTATPVPFREYFGLVSAGYIPLAGRHATPNVNSQSTSMQVTAAPGDALGTASQTELAWTRSVV